MTFPDSISLLAQVRHVLGISDRQDPDAVVTTVRELVRENARARQPPTEDQAKRIVAAIERDLSDRRGLRQAWDEIERDVQGDIRASWVAEVMAALSPPTAAKETT